MIKSVLTVFLCSIFTNSRLFCLLSAGFLWPFFGVGQTWPVLGNESQLASEASNYTSIATVEVRQGDDGFVTVPYVAFTESGIAKVKRYVNGAWEGVGGNVSDGSASYTYIFSDDNGKLYVNYVDASTTGASRLAVKTYNTTSSAWEPLGGLAANLYLSSGSIIQNNGSQLNSSHNSWMAFDSNNVPYVIFSEFSTGGNPFVKRFTKGVWETVGGGAISAADKAPGVGIAIDQSTNIPYVVYLAGTGTSAPLKVLSYSNSTWNVIAFPAATLNGANSGNVTGARHSSITLDNDNNIHVAYFNAMNSNKATVVKYTKSSSTWSFLATVSTRDATYVNILKALDGSLYVSYIDALTNGGTSATAKVSKLPAGSNTWKDLTNADATNTFIDQGASNIHLAVSASNKEYLVYTKTNSASVVTPVVRTFSSAAPPPPPPPAPDVVVTTPKQMELLSRGLVAVRLSSSQVYLSWRMFGTDPSGISFNVYRDGTKLNATPITTSTNYTDNASTNGSYTIKPVLNGVEQAATAAVSVWSKNQLSIPLQIPAGGTTPTGEAYTYNANDASVGDLDGDGEYEIILKWDPSNAKDNSQSGYTGNVYLDAYKLNGTRLWRINLGKNIRAGAHYTQFMVYDLDGDGYAEVACKTADGTVDGAGTVIGDASADYRNSSGYILSGPEFLTVFNGRTGAAMATKNYLPARGTVSSWGDSYGNRVDRFIAAVAYVDGARPSLIMGRGYYTRQVRAAWDWRDGKLTSRWVFDSNDPGNSAHFGQGNHQMTVGDVDGDGKDEIFNGSDAINDNGVGLWADGKGHGDALHMSDMDPSLEGQEIWMCHESPSSYGGTGLTLRKAKTGELIWGVPATGDVGRAMAADIDPRYPGYELWGAAGGNVYTNKGVSISTNVPSMNFGVWWDGDLSRELLNGTTLDKWNTSTNSAGRLLTIYNEAPISSNNGTKATPCLSADILGDWREEMIFRSSDNSSLILFTTNIPTQHRIYTLMHDPQYRVAVAWQNSAYNQPPHPGFFLGTDMTAAPTPNISLVSAAPATPTITAAGSTTACEGVGVSLSSSASSGNQWFKDGTSIANATGSTYVATASGAYTVKATTLCCTSAASAAVNVSISPAPVATITPAGPVLFSTGSVILNANAGTGYTYRWSKDGSEITGATNASLTVSESGSYRVLVTAAGCQTTSEPVLVTKRFSLPASNFRILLNGETCSTSNNGKLIITATENLNYTAILLANGVSTPYTFSNNTLTISNLSAGNYSLCITVEGQAGYNQCFNNLVIKEPQDLSVYSSVDESNNKIRLNLSGGSSYHINLNGQTYSTSKNIIELPLTKGNNKIMVTTDSQCQGTFEKIITLNDKVILYPNPFESTLNLKLGAEASQLAEIEVKSVDGKLMYKKHFFNSQSDFHLELSHLSKGVYILKLTLDKSESFYKIVKQ